MSGVAAIGITVSLAPTSTEHTRREGKAEESSATFGQKRREGMAEESSATFGQTLPAYAISLRPDTAVLVDWA